MPPPTDSAARATTRRLLFGLGEALRTMRTTRGRSFRQLLPLNATTIRRAELGTGGLYTAVQLAEALDCDVRVELVSRRRA